MYSPFGRRAGCCWLARLPQLREGQRATATAHAGQVWTWAQARMVPRHGDLRARPSLTGGSIIGVTCQPRTFWSEGLFFFFLVCSQNQCGFFSDFSWALLGLSCQAWIHGCQSSVMSPVQTRSLFAHFPPDLDNLPVPTTTVPCPLDGKGGLRGLYHLCQHSPLDRTEGSRASGSVGCYSCLIKGNRQRSRMPARLPLSRECIYSQPAADPE